MSPQRLEGDVITGARVQEQPCNLLFVVEDIVRPSSTHTQEGKSQNADKTFCLFTICAVLELKTIFFLSLNLLLRWFGGVLVAQFDRAASQVLFLDPPIPWGKVPSKNLLGHQKLIGPTPRPASHWLVPTNFAAKLFRGSILLLRLHLRARRSCDICLGNYI